MDKDDIFVSLFVIAFMAFLLICYKPDKYHYYLVRRLDNNLLQEKKFDNPQQMNTTVIAYDTWQGADGPIYVPVQVTIVDTIYHDD